MLKGIINSISIIFCSLLIVTGGVFIISNSAPADLDAKAFELKSYCRSGGYNTDYGILVDYSRHSFQQRFYVVDLNTGDIVMRSLGCITLPFIAYKRVAKILHSQCGNVIMWVYE